MMHVRNRILLTLGTICLLLSSGAAHANSYDPSLDDTPSPVAAYMISHGITLTPLPPLAPGIHSWTATSPQGDVQHVNILSDGLTFLAGSEEGDLPDSEKPRADGVADLGQVVPGVEGWLPRAWMTQSLDGILYTVEGASVPVKGYVYRLFPDRDLIDNLSAIQLAQFAAGEQKLLLPKP